MFTVDLDPKPLITAMNGMDAQMPFAVMRSLNETAVQFQQDERRLMDAEFTIRRPWVKQGIKIDRGDFATKNKLEVRIHISKDRDFLFKFERGGIRVPRGGRSKGIGVQGAKGLAVPVAARSSPTTVIPAGKRPRAFHFHAVQASKLTKLIRGQSLSGAVGRMRVFEGDKRTIMLQSANGTGVILQRVGRSKKHGRTDPGLIVLYVLRTRTRVPADLHFTQTARATFAKQWPISFTKWWNEAVRTAHTGKPIAQGQALPAGWTE